MGSESTSNQPDTTGTDLGSFEGDTVLIAYDGSAEANGAIDYAGRFLSTKNAYILTVWEPIHRQAARTAGMSGMMQHDWSSLGDDTEDPAYADAVEICREGVALAESHGFATEPFLVESATAVWSAIVDASRELDVSIIVAGSRALTGWRSLLQSSVSDSLVKHAGRPVLIVPPVDEDEDADAEATPAGVSDTAESV
ncbi:MAG TPA: universal stress protein [Candidatus Corynebacterium avicola]|uniref:Universal stress protein n=1 Tax=Candidatus Corynebacterium avicola TaxID=2838527 RepID=A0A9D1RPB5_9CORY|nr:universal stress protein [Candidatus Corynebacterium avicola]